MQPFSLYLHIPFCRHRCSYCDFNTYAGLESSIESYVHALCAEAEILAEKADRRLLVHSVFFGGGTPSLLSPTQLRQILNVLARCYQLTRDIEITLEANPETLSGDYLKELYASGVNRLSIGMQSARPDELRLLERGHDYFTVKAAVQHARRAGFTNIILDLIFGLPGQTLENWQQSLQLAVSLDPDHLSLYCLTLEHGTPLASWVARGLLPEPDADLAADMYEWSAAFLLERGYRQYEISNWAKGDGMGGMRACRHNLQYWRCLPYLGLGAGAHGFAGGFRTVNVRSPQAYIQRLPEGSLEVWCRENDFPRSPATVETLAIDQFTEMNEMMLMGLRLTEEGVSRREFYDRFGRQLEEVYGEVIAKLEREGLVHFAPPDFDRLRLSPRGRLLGNRVFIHFV